MDWIQLEGESMRPCLQSGDWIAVEWVDPIRPLLLRPGDIVLAKNPAAESGEWLVHRVVRTKSGAPSIKGDASFAWDELSRKDIWATVVSMRAGTETSPEKIIRNLWLDRWIAWFSSHTVPPSSFKAKFARRAVRLCGKLRRALF